MSSGSEIPYVDGMDYGVGFDTASGSARSSAATGLPSTVASSPGGTVSFSMEEVDTVESLSTSLGISAQAGGGVGLFSASARFNFAQSCQVNDQSIFLVVSVQVTQGFETVQKPGIDPFAASLLANGQTDRFREMYGDTFVRGMRSGGQFFGVIEVHTESKEDKQNISIAMSASYAAFSASGTFDKTFQDTVTNHHTTVKCHVEGGDPNQPMPIAVDTMTARATKFPTEVTANAMPYQALIDDYGVLPLPQAPNFADLQQQKDVLAECAQLRDAHQQWLNNIEYINKYANEFINPDSAALNQLQNDIDADLNLIASAASTAINNPKDAQLPTGLRVTAPSFPQRKATPTPPTPTVLVTVPQWNTEEDWSVGGTNANGTFIPSASQAGLVVRDVFLGNDGSHDVGDIDHLDPAVGTQVPVGSTVTAYMWR